jgi:Uma2 family endonuclease
MTPTTAAPMTAEEFFAWANHPENAGRRYELEDGRVVEMSSPGEAHALVCWFVTKVLTEYVVRRGSGHLLTNDCGLVVRRSPDTVRGPDVMLSTENLTLDRASPGHSQRIPSLVVEVISPTDRPKAVNRRVNQYLSRGVPLVWEVHPGERLVWVHRPGEFSKVLDETDELIGNGVLPDFSCPVWALFGLTPPTTP